MTRSAFATEMVASAVGAELAKLHPWPPIRAADEFGSPVKLDDGSTGYHMRRTDDCLRAAIATCLNVPMVEVPDTEFDEQLTAGLPVDYVDRSYWDELTAWLCSRGLRVLVHRDVPVRRRRWIGVAVHPGIGPFGNHCLVMAGDEMLHDPLLWTHRSHALEMRRLQMGRIEFGYSFQRSRRS